MRQLSVLYGELSNTFEVQHQPALVTLVHVPEGKVEEEGGEENEEEQGEERRVAEMDRLCHGGRNEWIPAGSVFDCDLQGRKINFTNSKTLVGRCRDRRDAPLACPNVKNLQKIKKRHQK